MYQLPLILSILTTPVDCTLDIYKYEAECLLDSQPSEFNAGFSLAFLGIPFLFHKRYKPEIRPPKQEQHPHQPRDNKPPDQKAVPEPGTIIGTILGGAYLLRKRR